VSVALNDQKMTGMRFGEILAARGWVKQQTIEYLMRKVIIPEQKAAQPPASHTAETNGSAKQAQMTAAASDRQRHESHDGLVRRDPPVSKPLPSYSADSDKDGGVSWVG
jgi:hypothetical protein